MRPKAYRQKLSTSTNKTKSSANKTFRHRMLATKLKIRLYGDPCLRKKSVPVKKAGAGERMLIDGMMDAMYEHKGVGLAAPQVGINEQIIVADIGEGPHVFI